MNNLNLNFLFSQNTISNSGALLLIFSLIAITFIGIILLIVRKIISEYNSIVALRNMNRNNKNRGNVDLAFCVVKPQTWINLNGTQVRMPRQAVFVYPRFANVHVNRFVDDYPYPAIYHRVIGKPYILNKGNQNIGQLAVVNIDGQYYHGYLYINLLPNNIYTWPAVFVALDYMWLERMQVENDVTTMGQKLDYVTTYEFTCDARIRNSFKTPKDLNKIKPHL